MNTIIVSIIVYVGWMIIKNVLKEMGSPGSVTGQRPTPPVVNRPAGMPRSYEYKPVPPPQPVQPARPEQTQAAGSIIYENEKYEPQPAVNQGYKVRKNVEKFQSENQRSSEEIKKEEVNPLEFAGNSLVNGIIMSEVLGKPRSKRNIM